MDIQQSERTSINLRERKISPLSLSLYLSLYLSLHFQTCGRKPLNYCPRVQYVVRYIGNEELVLVTNNFEYDIHFFLFCPLHKFRLPVYCILFLFSSEKNPFDRLFFSNEGRIFCLNWNRPFGAWINLPSEKRNDLEVDHADTQGKKLQALTEDTSHRDVISVPPKKAST